MTPELSEHHGASWPLITDPRPIREILPLVGGSAHWPLTTKSPFLYRYSLHPYRVLVGGANGALGFSHFTILCRVHTEEGNDPQEGGWASVDIGLAGQHREFGRAELVIEINKLKGNNDMFARVRPSVGLLNAGEGQRGMVGV